MMSSDSPFLWEDDFPPVYSHTSISFLKRCPGFAEAKRGDMAAAQRVVDVCVKPRRAAAIREKYPLSLLLPIMSENRLPEAYARSIGLEIDCGVRIVRPVGRKTMSCAERLLRKPVFSGGIRQGKSYLLIDDIVSSGGTVAALRKYVLDRGGCVCAVAVLALSAGGGILKPTPETISYLGEKFDYARISGILKSHRIADDPRELTYPEILYLLKFKEAKGIEEMLRVTTNKYEKPGSFYVN